eukprot:3151673-Pyramimonas_sp.AAC.1
MREVFTKLSARVARFVHRKNLNPRSDLTSVRPVRCAKKCEVRAMSWSPSGCTPHGGCLLAVCTSDHRLRANTICSFDCPETNT